MKKITILTLTLALGLVCGTLQAAISAGGVKQSFSSVPAAEVPAKAAELVKAARAKERPAVAVQAVNDALEINPTLAPAVVGAIAKSSPETAALAAGAAAQRQPKLAAEIARAAAAAAPSMAGKIVAAVCRAVPADYKKIAVAVAEVAPGAGKEILQGVGSGIPEIKPQLSAAMAANRNQSSVAAVLESPQMANATPGPASAIGGVSTARGPSIAPPYVPYSGSTGNVRPSDSGPVPRGDRNYASP